MQNRFRLAQLATEHGIAVTKELPVTDIDGRVTALVISKSVDELRTELQAAGVIQ